MVSPCAATIGTTIMEVRLPGIPPMQCLSTIDRLIPFELRSRLSHRAGEGEKLVARHEAGGTDQERGDFHVGIAIVREVIDDCVDFRRAQRLALDLGAHGVEAVRGRCGRDRHQSADRFGKATKRRLGKAEIFGTDESIVVRDQQGCQQHLRVAAQFDRLKPRNTSGRSAFDRREITATFSRPVSRLTRRIFSCGRDVSAAFIM